jgi:ATP-dependent RNA helicase DDX10/DBP4
LFATDLAARGLDFPRVDFVIHVDIPSNEKLYIHRSGRTARYNKDGKSVLLLTEREKSFIDKMKDKSNIEIEEMDINISKIVSIKQQLSSIVSQDVKLKFLALKYFYSCFFNF